MLKLAKRLLGEPCAGEVALTLAGARFWEASSLREEKSFMLLFSLFLSTIFYSDVAVGVYLYYTMISVKHAMRV
jgi:hypothetical protein